jgi:hypothetical protein
MRATRLFASFAALLLAAPVLAAPRPQNRVATLPSFSSLPQGGFNPLPGASAKKAAAGVLPSRGFGSGGQGLLGGGGARGMVPGQKPKTPVLKYPPKPRKLEPYEHVGKLLQPDETTVAIDVLKRMFQCAVDCTSKEMKLQLRQFRLLNPVEFINVFKTCQKSPNCGGGPPLGDTLRLPDVNPQNLAKSAQQAAAAISSHAKRLGENGVRLASQFQQELATRLVESGVMWPIAITVATICVAMVVTAAAGVVVVGAPIGI